MFDKEEYKVRYVDSIAWKVFYYGFYDPDKMKLNSYWYDIVLVIRICDNNTMGVIFEYPYNTRDKLFKI
ncbi:hypothetical protein FLA_0454 [Filimonas lacunae]|nr:hypothetical protein FLA_0454 [Filimonas lacunae]